MIVKTTLMIDKDIYKACKIIALETDTNVSSMLRKALLIYISDPDAVEETVELLKDKNVMAAINAGRQARKKGKKKYYIDWKKIRDL